MSIGSAVHLPVHLPVNLRRMVPVQLALILRAVLLSAVELVPVAPIVALRTAAALLLTRPLIETLHARGLPAALRAPRAFGRAVALRRACARAPSAAAWRAARRALEELEGRGAWRDALHSPYYDAPLVTRAAATLRRLRSEAEARRPLTR